MITEQLMAPGRFDIALRRVPDSVIMSMQERGHIFVLPSDHDFLRLTDTEIQAMALYGGRMFTKPQTGLGEYQISGYGMASWLGMNGRGHVLETTLSYPFPGTAFNTVITALLPQAVTAGTITGTPGNYVGEFFGRTPIEDITQVCETLDAEWRVNHDASLDAGTTAELFVTTPVAMIIRRAVVPDAEDTITAFDGNSMLTTENAEEWVSKVLLQGSGEFAGGSTDLIIGSADLAAIGLSNPYKDLLGNPDTTSIMVPDPVAFVSLADVRAEELLRDYAVIKQSITLDTYRHDIKGRISVGDTVYAYSPPFLVDPNEKIRFQGAWVSPAKVRVIGVSWPIDDTMTVLYRNHAGTYFDISPYVVVESGPTLIQVAERYRKPLSLAEKGLRRALNPGPPTVSGTMNAKLVSDPAIGTVVTGVIDEGVVNPAADSEKGLTSDGVVTEWRTTLSRGIDLADDSVTAFDSWEDWDVQIVNLTKVAGEATVVTGHLTGFCLIAGTAGQVHLARIRIGVSFDNGATWQYSQEGVTEMLNTAGTKRDSVATQIRRTGTVTTALRVKAQIYVHSGNGGAVGDITFSEGALIVRVDPT